jgi:hypothetical protein
MDEKPFADLLFAGILFLFFIGMVVSLHAARLTLMDV